MSPVKDTTKELTDVAVAVVEAARLRGAEAAEALVRESSDLSVKVRMGEPEMVEEAGSRALGLRVFLERRAATAYTSDFTKDGIARFVADAVALARLSEPDPFHELPEKSDLCTPAQANHELDLFDEAVLAIDAGKALAEALKAENAARKLDKRITSSEGATYGRTAGSMAFANSQGFSGAYRGTYASLYVEPICDDTDGKKRNGHWWTASRHLKKLEDSAAVGEEATRRTLRMLGAKKPKTCEVPVVFDPDVGRDLVGLLASVISGGAIWRKSSYLIGREHTQVASPLVTIIDDPLLAGAPASRPFDGDGLPSRRNVVVDQGELKTYLLDVYSARKLEKKSTGSASRQVGGNPHPGTTNFIMQPGRSTPEEVLAPVKDGFYVTEMMGFGFNPVTGDFSRGAAGFWIENGQKTYPVSEATVSCNFDELLKRIDGVGNDLRMRSATEAPTFRVSSMIVGGA